MADISKAKDFNFPKIISEFGGYVSSIDRTNIADNLMVRGSQNVHKKLSGTLAVRPGQKRQGAANTVLSSVSSSFVWNTSWGATRTMAIADSKLYVVIDEVWYQLLSSLTKTRYVFDNWWDNTEKKDRVLFVNGTDDMFHWSGGYAVIASTTANTITKTGTTSWVQEGFSSTAGELTVVINGTTYTYTGGQTTTTLTGVTADPTGEANGSNVLQAVQTDSNSPASGFLSDFIKVINNQVYVGSYTSRLIYMSQDTDFTNYVVPTPQIAGSPGLFVMDGVVNGIGVRQGKAHVGFGTSGWAIISFALVSNNSVITRVNTIDVKPVAILQAPYAHEFIDNVGDNLVYLGQDQQVRVFGDFNNLFVSGYPSISQEVARELEEENFTGGTLVAVGEYIYLSAPVSGKVYLRQERTRVDTNGNVVAERLWHSPFVWNAVKIDQIDGVVVAFSNANPQIYEVWGTNQWYDDSPDDEQLPYTCILALGYRGESRRHGLWEFDKQFTEGYLSAGTTLMLQMNYDYEGAENIVNVPVNSETRPATLFQINPATMGDSPLGAEPLGDSSIADFASDLDTLPKFKVINSLPLISCFEYQPIYYSDSVNSQWEILAVGTNATVSDKENANFLINKNRN